MTTPTLPPSPPGQRPADIAALVERYRSGDSQAASELLDRFAPYRRKWVRLLRQAQWHGDPEVEEFLALVGSHDLQASAQLIRQRLRVYDREDLEQDVTVTLLACLLRYGGVRNFRFLLFRRLRELTRDPLVFRPSAPLERAPAPTPPAESLDDLWVEGWTCGPGFEQLDALERRILRLHYHDGYTIAETAELLEVTVSRVNRTIARTKELLRPLVP